MTDRPAPDPPLTPQQPTAALPEVETCDWCGSTDLWWRNCRLFCRGCSAIVKSCGDF